MPISNPAVGHRTWNWADEVSWKNHSRIPLGVPTKVGTAFSIRVGKFDSARVVNSSICHYQGNYYNFYEGYNGAINQQGIAKATASEFPATWTQYDTPILPTGGAAAWDEMTGDGYVIVDEEAGFYKLYYCGYRVGGGAPHANMGLATCPLTSDPTAQVNWTENLLNPIWSLATFATVCGALKLGNLYYVFFWDTTHNHIHVATSTNGTTFTDRGAAVNLGAGGTWDDVYTYYASLFFNQGIIYCLYSGYSGSRVGIGVAMTHGNPVGIPYDKAWENPVLVEADRDIHHPAMIMVNEKFYLYYTDEAFPWSVKYATIP
jgi:hypothetical protein